MSRFFQTITLAVLTAVFSCAALAQSSGVTCYSKQTGQRVPCPRPAPPPPPPATNTPSPNSNNDSAKREAEERAAEEKRRDDAARAEGERLRVERERHQEKFERDKQDALNSLKGNSSGDTQLKGASSGDLKLKEGPSTDLKLKDPSTDYNRVRTPAATVAAVRGGSGFKGVAELDTKTRDRFVRLAPAKLKSSWTRVDEARVRNFLSSSPMPGWAYDHALVSKTWAAVLEENPDGTTIRNATTFASPAVRSGTMVERQDFGQQATNSCALHAIANALQIPLTDVWSRTAEIFEAAYGGTTNERKDINVALSKGLYSEEFAVIAESLGRIEVVGPKRFSALIAAGKPVLVHLAVPDTSGNMGHEVVLDRTFQMNGETWYEMVDSNQTGQWDRRFLSASELNVLLKEKGLVVHPELTKKVRSRRK